MMPQRYPPRVSQAAERIQQGVFAELEKNIAAFAAKGGELIPLHIGDTHLAPPAEARFSAVLDGEASNPSLYRYGPTAGVPALREAIAAHLREQP